MTCSLGMHTDNPLVESPCTALVSSALSGHRTTNIPQSQPRKLSLLQIIRLPSRQFDPE